MLADHLPDLGAVGLEAHDPAFGQQVGAVLGNGGQHAVAAGVVFARLVAEIGLAGGTAVGVIAGHRQVVGVQSATCQIVDQRLVVRRKRRRCGQTDLGGLRAQGIGLAANPEQLFGLGVPGHHLVVADRPGLGHGGIAGVAEVLPGGEIAHEKSFADHAVQGRGPAGAAADERHEPLREAPADVFDFVGGASGAGQGVVVRLCGTGRSGSASSGMAARIVPGVPGSVERPFSTNSTRRPERASE